MFNGEGQAPYPRAQMMNLLSEVGLCNALMLVTHRFREPFNKKNPRNFGFGPKLQDLPPTGVSDLILIDKKKFVLFGNFHH